MLEPFFRQQFGLVTRAQARQAGLTDRQIDHRLRTGHWLRVVPRIYRHGAWPATFEQRALAACLALDDAVASHRTAAVLEGVHGGRPANVEVSVLAGRGHRSPIATVHQVRHLPEADRVVVRGVPCTSVARTIVDLAPRLSPPQLEEAVDRAVVQRRSRSRRSGSPSIGPRTRPAGPGGGACVRFWGCGRPARCPTASPRSSSSDASRRGACRAPTAR